MNWKGCGRKRSLYGLSGNTDSLFRAEFGANTSRKHSIAACIIVRTRLCWLMASKPKSGRCKVQPRVKVTEARTNNEQERVKPSTPDTSVGASQLRDFYT
jgi:hypothetical protein